LNNPGAQGARASIVGLPDDVMVQAGMHLATYYNSNAGRLRISVPFLRDGIKLGQPCFLVASGEVLESYILALEQEVGAELARARRRGIFATAPTPGQSVEEAIAFWADWIAGTAASNHPILRIVGEMAGVKATFPSMREMLIFERRLGSLFKDSPVVAICQYDVREFDGPSLLEAIKAHPDVSDLGFVKFVS
jgi:hypothetical protein